MQGVMPNQWGTNAPSQVDNLAEFTCNFVAELAFRNAERDGAGLPLNGKIDHDTSEDQAPILKDARALRSSVALREALLKLLDVKPFDQITVRDICAEASVHYATFFRHHASKEALLDYVAADQIATVVNLTLPIREEVGDASALNTLCNYIDERRGLWDVLLNGGAGAALREEWLTRARSVAEQREPLNSWLPKDLGTICSVSLIVETISWWLNQPVDQYSADEVAKILSRLITSATLSPD